MREAILHDELPYVPWCSSASDAGCLLGVCIGEIERAVRAGELKAEVLGDPFPLSLFESDELTRYYRAREDERTDAAALPEDPVERLPAGAPLAPSEHYLYVIEIEGHCVKIGITKNVNKRVAEHRRNAEAHGRTIGQIWHSGPHANARANESRLKGSSRREYMDVPFDKMKRRAWSLSFIREVAHGR